jgi:nitrous oxidase accessory protein NosD
MLYRNANLVVCSLAALGALCQTAAGATLCVNAKPTPTCTYSTIGAAVAAASAGDVIQVSHGTYREEVTIGKPISLLGENSNNTIIDATGLPNGIFVDGLDNAGLQSVTISGFTVQNAEYEGVLVVNATDVTVSGNNLLNNDKSPSVFTGATNGCPGQPAFETDETGDCGGGLHLMGVADSIVSGNNITGNADGILISDDTGESHGNLIVGNNITDNPLECGIVLASHPPMGHTSPPYAPHYGVDHNTVSGNVSTNNGVKVGGSGVGLFSDGNGLGRTSENVIIGNTLTGNGLGGVALHTHVGPTFGLPADDMNGNMIIGNAISKNLADLDDTKTPGRVGDQHQ